MKSDFCKIAQAFMLANIIKTVYRNITVQLWML